MYKHLGSILVALLLSSGSSYAGSLQQDFAVLFERCRIAVEQSIALNTMNLQTREVNEKQSRSWGMESSQLGWAFTNSELYIVTTAWTSRDGSTRNLCDIYPQDPDYRLSQDQQGRLLRHFLLRQTQLIGEGSHEIDRRLSPIPPALNLAFLLSAHNPKGCTVTNNIAVSPDGTFLAAGSGEQAIKACDTNYIPRR